MPAERKENGIRWLFINVKDLGKIGIRRRNRPVAFFTAYTGTNLKKTDRALSLFFVYFETVLRERFFLL